MPVFQASGSQRGTSKDMDTAWQAETEDREMIEGNKIKEAKTLPRNKEMQSCRRL
jgi:hypothetical protein